MKRLQSVSESIKTIGRVVNESFVENDKMMYADAIAKELQKKKTELGNVWTTEIVNSNSDYGTGIGGGTIKYLKPAVPDELEFHVEISNRKSPEPTVDEEGNEVPGDNVVEEMGDVKVSVSINDNPVQEKSYTNQPLAGVKELVVGCVMEVVDSYNAKQKVEEA